ncbi:hypothetical protein AAF712_015503, partial [Marasmius tenuissimus]
VSSWPKPRANKKVSVEVEKEATDAPEHDNNTFIAAGAETGHSTKKRSSFTPVDASPVVWAGVSSLSTEFSTVPAPLSTMLASKRAEASLSTKATLPLGPQISATPPSESPSALSAGCTRRSVGTRNPGGSRLRPDLSVVTTLAPASDIPLMSATLSCSSSSLSSTSSSLSVAYPNSAQRTVEAQPRPLKFSALVAGLYRTPTASLSDSAALSVDVDPTPTRSSSSESLHVSRTTKRAPSLQHPIARAQPQPDVQGAISTVRPSPTTNAVLKAIKTCLIANLTGTATMHTGHFPVAKTSTATTAIAIPSRERQNLPAKCVLPGDNGTANKCCICHETLFKCRSFDRFGVDHDVKGL